MGSGRKSIDFAEIDVAGAPIVHHNPISEFPTEEDFNTSPRVFDRLLVMSQRRMRCEKFKKEKRVTGRVIVKNTNMYTKWKGELRIIPNDELFKRYLD